MTGLFTDTIAESTSGSGITFSNDVVPATPLSHRNMVINGAMQVAQRGESETGIGATSGYFTVDRFVLNAGNTAGRLTMTQETITDLAGFAKAVKLDCTATANTPIASDERLLFVQRFEGQDLQQIKKGTSDAEKVTVSFYVKGNASATYTLELVDEDNSRYVAQEFSVTSSWTRVTKTFVADTTGKFDNDNDHSMSLNIWLHAGSDFNGGTFTSNTVHTTSNQRVGDNQTSFYDSEDRTFFITGVQLELGSVATPFEYRSYGEELARCQRYYYVYGDGSIDADQNLGVGYGFASTQLEAIVRFPVEMNHSPDLKQNSGTDYYQFFSSGEGIGVNFMSVFSGNKQSILLYKPSVTCTHGRGYRFHIKHASAYLHFEAEL